MKQALIAIALFITTATISNLIFSNPYTGALGLIAIIATPIAIWKGTK